MPRPSPHSLHDICADIVAIASVVGHTTQGHEVVAAMQQEIAPVRDRVQAAQMLRPTVFCEEWGKPLIASQPWVAELVDAAGGNFVSEPGKQVALESIHAADPDILVAAWCGAGDRVPLEKIVAQRGWSNLRAARNAHVYCIPDEFLNTPAPMLLRGLHALAAVLHPTLFPETSSPRTIRATAPATPSQENYR